MYMYVRMYVCDLHAHDVRVSVFCVFVVRSLVHLLFC